MIFWGFFVLMLQVVTLFGRTFDADWSLPLLGEDDALGPAFEIARDAVEVLVVVGVVYMLYRRLIAHTPRLFGLKRAEQRYRSEPHWEGVLILFFILLIVVGGFLYDHASSEEVVRSRGGCTTRPCWSFLCLLPLSKHFHIITSIPNLFVASCRRTTRRGRWRSRTCRRRPWRRCASRRKGASASPRSTT